MSYARFGEGDVYIFGGCAPAGEEPIWYCQWCPLLSAGQTVVGDPHSVLGIRVEGAHDFTTHSLAALRDHVREHVAAGHDVPARCTERIDEELGVPGDSATREER